ncbi:MAG TPA: FecR domain-containing protein [Pirellulales bacterium]|nr:FecR domain-containing protein [Pirellulales bacterium]
MDCRQAIESIEHWMDGELGAAEQASLELHLASCSMCAGVAEAAKLTDAELQRAFAPRRRAAEALAERVAAQLRHERPDARLPARGWPLLAAAAAGFLFAVGIFRPWRHDEPQLAAPAAPIARLAAATGAPELLPRETVPWFTCPPSAPIEPGACVRTGPDARCELDTPTGCQLRLNCGTEVRFDGPRQVELRRGRLWSNVSEMDQTVDVKQARASVAARQAQFDISCQPGEATLTVVKGAATVRGAREQRTVSAGEQVKIVAGEISEGRPPLDPLLDASWMNELVCLKGPDNPELIERVDDILAQIGETKLAYLYEDEIRRLGDRAVGPLLKFIASDRSRSDPKRRDLAARLVADLAPWPATADLIGLLDDHSPIVRESAARALFRLTGRDLGYSLDQWRDPSGTISHAGPQAWRDWWAESQNREGGLAAEPKSKGDPPPPFKKARGPADSGRSGPRGKT